jgi:probable O-glycosylation ligase (exosortase A-associated)
MAMSIRRPARTSRRSPAGPPPSERLAFGHGAYAPVPSAAAAAAELAHEPKPFSFTHLETWDWGWGGLLILSILLFFRPQEQVTALGNAHRSEVAAIIGLVAMVALNSKRHEPLTRITPELLGVMGLGLVMLITMPLSFWPGGSFGVFKDYYIKVALVFMLMVNTVTSPRRIERICWVIVLAFGYISLRAWIDYARGTNLVEGGRVAGAAGGFFENPNDLALNLAAFLPLAMMYVKRPGAALKRLLSAGIVILMLGAIVFTKSRSGLLGAVAMFGVYLIATRSLKPSVVIGLIVTAMLVVPMMPQSFWDRMASITNGDKDTTGSREERRQLMEQAWTIFLENPLTGIGAGQFQNYGPPGQAKKWRVTHNAYLQVAAELGVFGVAFFLFIVWRGFSAAWWTRQHLNWIYRRRSRKKAPAEPEDGLTADERYFLQTHAAALLACMTGWAICAIFASVAFNWTIYYLLGLSVAARDVVRARQRAYAKAKKLALEQDSVAA